MKKLIKVGALAAATLALSANAATQGALVHGTDTSITSEGSLEVLLNIDYVIQVNELDDLDLGNFASGVTQDLVGSDDFCVFTNAQSFSLRMYSDGNDGWQLRDVNGFANPIPYAVSLNSVDLSSQVTFLANMGHDTTKNNITETRNRRNCDMDDGAGGFAYKPNLNVNVTVDENDMLDAIPSSYKDVIVFVASPE
jgi:hypothetical protein